MLPKSGLAAARPWEVPVIVSLLRERRPGERRVLLLPQDAARLCEICDLQVETGAGRGLGIPDDAYVQAGARITGVRTHGRARISC